MNVLSLDPMYSPLHQLIMDKYSDGQKFTILSSLGLSVYFSGTTNAYINKEIPKYIGKISSEIVENVVPIVNHHSMLLKKVLSRKIIKSELDYFCAFYIYFQDFIQANNIDLVLMHNDLRWQHSIAVYLCRKHGVKYLVTEQGLFRPNTTMVDSSGVNAYSNVKDDFLNNRNFGDPGNEITFERTHDSYLSYFNFLKYLALSKVGYFFGYESLIVHKRHSFKEYIKRYTSSLFLKTKNKRDKITSKNIIFVPLQLELDTQLLVHSDFNNNQEVIDSITQSFMAGNLSDKYQLVFKYHPNDNVKYDFSSHVKITDSIIDDEFLYNVKLVISVNSSALLNVLTSQIPVITLGRSIYDLDGVAEFSSIDNLAINIKRALDGKFNISKRNGYIEFLKKIFYLWRRV